MYTRGLISVQVQQKICILLSVQFEQRFLLYFIGY